MIRLIIFCEGQTEQGFCTQVLEPHLFPGGQGRLHTLATGKKGHHHVYGLGRHPIYDRIRRFIRNTIAANQQGEVYFTTMLDLYALPANFPGMDLVGPELGDLTARVAAIEEAFLVDIGHPRFIPYLQVHEFETMIFADPDALAWSFENCDEAIQRLKDIAASVEGIEQINDGRETAPSKRIIAALPEYEGRKSTAGPDIAESIGLPIIRAACPHLDRWLARLESICWG